MPKRCEFLILKENNCWKIELESTDCLCNYENMSAMFQNLSKQRELKVPFLSTLKYSGSLC